jgi:hypothetical protein
VDTKAAALTMPAEKAVEALSGLGVLVDVVLRDL